MDMRNSYQPPTIQLCHNRHICNKIFSYHHQSMMYQNRYENSPIWHHIPIVSHFSCTPKVFRVHIGARIVLHTIELERKDTGATIGGVRRSKCHATSWTTRSTRSRSNFHFRLGPISAPTWPPKLLHGIWYYLALYQGGHKEEEYHGALQYPRS